MECTCVHCVVGALQIIVMMMMMVVVVVVDNVSVTLKLLCCGLSTLLLIKALELFHGGVRAHPSPSMRHCRKGTCRNNLIPGNMRRS